MSAVRTEHYHHTEEQIREATRFALEVVAEHELDGALAAAVTVKVLELRVAKQIELVHAAPGLGRLAVPGGL